MKTPRIFRNLGYKAAALVLAFVLWGTAQGFRSVEESLDIPITLENVPPDVVVVEQSNRELNLRLRGSRAALRRAAKEVSRYRVSLEGAQPPELRHAVVAESLALPRGSRILFRSPSTVLVRLEPRTSKRVPVKADLVGTPPEGYRIDSVVVEPSEVVLEGASSELRRIRQVMTDRVDLSGVRAGLVQEVRLMLDADHVWRADPAAPVRLRVQISPSTDGAATPPPTSGGS